MYLTSTKLNRNFKKAGALPLFTKGEPRRVPHLHQNQTPTFNIPA